MSEIVEGLVYDTETDLVQAMDKLLEDSWRLPPDDWLQLPMSYLYEKPGDVCWRSKVTVLDTTAVLH